MADVENGVIISPKFKNLGEIMSPGCLMAIWDRKPPVRLM